MICLFIYKIIIKKKTTNKIFCKFEKQTKKQTPKNKEKN